MIEIKQFKDDTRGYFLAYVKGKIAGGLWYTSPGETEIIIDHTEVKKAFHGQGIGQKLVLHIVDYARENNIKIQLVCTFAKSVFEKNESLRDVLQK